MRCVATQKIGPPSRASDVKEPHEYRRHPINFAVSSLSFLQTFELHFHEGPRLFGVNYLLYVGYQETRKVTVILV